MYAIIGTGGKQHKVTEGEVIFVEKLDAEIDSTYDFDEVYAISDNGNVTFGTPLIENAKVTAKVISHGKSKKIIVFKYKAKKNYRRKQGHRQPYTKVQIENIEK